MNPTDIRLLPPKDANRSGIYRYRSEIDDKVYVGSAKKFRTRKSAHDCLLCKGKHPNRHLQNAWNKYTEGNFIFEILDFVDDLDLLTVREDIWIENLDACSPEKGYNTRRVAHSNLGLQHSEEAKKKMSNKHAGVALSEWHCERISGGLIGKPKSEQHCENLSISHKESPAVQKQMEMLRIRNTGRSRSPESIQKTILANTGKKRTQETKNLMIAAWDVRREREKANGGGPLKGKPKSPETRAAMTAAWVLRKERKAFRDQAAAYVDACFEKRVTQ